MVTANKLVRDNLWRTCEHVSRPCGLWSFFPCASNSEVALDSFAVEFWGWLVLYSIVLSSMMLFKRSFGLTRSLFILYVHEHDRLGFGMLSVETAVIAFVAVDFNSSNCERKVSHIRSNIIWNRWKITLRARTIWVNLNQGTEMLCTSLIRPGKILESVARSLVTIEWAPDIKCLLRFELPA